MGNVQKTLEAMVDTKGNRINAPSKSIDKKRKAAFEAIVKKAILINMTRKQMANIPFDVTLAAKLCKDLKITNKAYIQVRKCILNPQYLINLRSLISDALLMVWNNTRPWDNTGFRILPMDCYDDFNDSFSKIKDDFEEAVQIFVDGYDTYVAEAKKDLGNAFNKNDYPDKADLKQYFSLDIQTSKFPDIDDIRLNLTNDELCQMQDEVVEKYTDALTSSMDKLFEMIYDGAKEKDDCVAFYKLIQTLNVSGDASINLKLKTAQSRLESRFGKDMLDAEKKEDDKSMLMIDDLEDFDEEELKEFEL